MSEINSSSQGATEHPEGERVAGKRAPQIGDWFLEFGRFGYSIGGPIQKVTDKTVTCSTPVPHRARRAFIRNIAIVEPESVLRDVGEQLTESRRTCRKDEADARSRDRERQEAILAAAEGRSQ